LAKYLLPIKIVRLILNDRSAQPNADHQHTLSPGACMDRSFDDAVLMKDERHSTIEELAAAIAEADETVVF